MNTEVQRNLLALTLGQVRRMEGRAVEWSQYNQARQIHENKKGDAK